MRTSLVAQEQPIQKIFSDDFVFHIPGYQRPYAWTTEQAGELFAFVYAVSDWKEDLNVLETEIFRPWMSFAWPSVEVTDWPQ